MALAPPGWAEPKYSRIQPAAFNNIPQPIVGYDTGDSGFGVYRGMPYWNVDLSVKKMLKITVRVNFFNHDQFGDPSGDYLDTSNAAGFGSLPGSVTSATTACQRQIRFGLRPSF